MQPGAVDEGVAAVHVGMEEAVAEHLVEEGLGALLHDLVRIVAGRQQRLAVADRDAVDPLQGQHALGGAVPVDGRRAIARIVGEVLAQLLAAAASMRRSISTRTTSAKARTEFDRLQPAEARLGALDQLGDPVEEIEVALEGELDARAAAP